MTELASPVQLSANDDNRGSGAEQPDLRNPLVAHVLVRGEGAHTEAHEEHVRLGIGQRSVFRILLMKHRSRDMLPQLVELLLPRRVKQPHLVSRVSHLDLRGVVFEHSGHVVAGEGVGGEADEETGLPHPAVPHHNALQNVGHHNIVWLIAA